mgnify:CR=1 FL=1
MTDLAAADHPRRTLAARYSASPMQVAALVKDGRSSKEIATRLGLAQKTVDNHRANLMDKLHRHDIAALTRYAVHRGIVSSH